MATEGRPEGRIIDLFAGAGGWDEGLKALGHQALGIEFDALACATGEAAGHERLQADVADLDPREFGPLWGLIGSPPCQAYSNAGKGLGRIDKPHVIACAHELAAGADTRAEHAAKCKDPRSLLTVEPLRWALALKPRWIALEQVPPVLELWTIFASLLAAHGYHAVAAVLSAEQYGVPQTRRRAFLIASLDGPVKLPEPTHRSYDPRRPCEVRDHERRLRPWVSMGDALGWRRPRLTYTNNQTCSGKHPKGLRRPTTCPARTLDTCSGSWTIEPIPDTATVPDGLDPRQGRAKVRPVTVPAFTLISSGLSHGQPIWVRRRPAPTAGGEAPSRRELGSAAPGSRRRDGCPHRNPARITVGQATVLQGFRADYPWQGSRYQQFRQIGNAVCPPVARVVLAEAMRIRR